MSFTAILGAAAPIVEKLIGLIPDKAEQLRLQQELEMTLVKMEHERALEQVRLNQEEAKHPSIWVAGWRPFIGWIGGFGLLWAFLLQPLLVWVATVSGYTGNFPTLETNELMSLVFAMLGVGTLRTVDKIYKVDTKEVNTKKTKAKPTFNQ